MTIARSQLVDVNVTPWYHVISKTVRGAWLLSHGRRDRKQWLQDRLEVLSQAFAIEVAGFAVMDNHLHLLVRLSPESVGNWTDEQVVRRWAILFPPRSSDRKPVEITQAWLEGMVGDAEFVAQTRRRLADLGWFMKALKEPLARMANKEDDCRGAFWEGRFKSIAILDDEALLATCAYIDLNPVAAGLAATPETSPYTSLHQRLEHAAGQGKLEELQAAANGSVAGSRGAGSVEEGLWLCPIDDRRRQGSLRVGLLEGFSLGSYLLLVDYTSRLYRQGKARVSRELASILDRLGTSAEVWCQRIQHLLGKKRLLGSYFCTDRQRLRQLAKQRGVHHLDNLGATPA